MKKMTIINEKKECIPVPFLKLKSNKITVAEYIYATIYSRAN